MTGHSTGMTSWHIARERRYQMFKRLERQDEIIKLEREITALANDLIDIMGKPAYDEFVELIVPEDASLEKARDLLAWQLTQIECRCVLPEQSCEACRAAATADLEPDEIPIGG